MFTLGIGTDPGAFSNDTATRTVDLPYFKKKSMMTLSMFTEQKKYKSIELEIKMVSTI